ncbi:MAG: isoprenylcysteine carboxylmethyltransferase family protein [Heliobacteriaceae bacterium]|nr:isoprenylcysteine carboxylmethyltransferase family protein [Heliobacteriaceae bacterium]
MGMWAGLFIGLLILQRLGELGLARRNTAYIVSRGGYEAGAGHYKFIVTLHILFFVSLAGETGFLHRTPPPWWPVPCGLFCLAQMLRYWSIFSLGRFWNTRIFVLPGAAIVFRGPYKYLRHPNYLAVIIELVTVPLILGAFFTAGVFSLANLALLSVRIQAEEKALRDVNRKNLNEPDEILR